jgi:alkylation response protein AidB-like acyl-CoA dehydrogenase
MSEFGISAFQAHMARQVESTHALIEFTAYQFKMMADDEKLDKMPGLISLLKVQTTMTFEYCAREAAQILGGLAYTRGTLFHVFQVHHLHSVSHRAGSTGGLGEKVERLYREVRAYAIPGGSEEIMCDVGMKMAIKSIKDLRRALKEQAENAKPASKL